MLRLLSIRNFAVIQSLELELDGGFTVLTGETGAGKSILLDALSLLLGDRFETRQLRAGADRAEVAADFDVRDNSALRGWLADQDLPCEESLLLRRILDTQGRSRGYINGRPATLAQLKEAGERLVDLHGQHAHQSLGRPETQRELVDAFGGFATLARETANAWRRWREAIEHRAQGERDVAVWRQEREALSARHRELEALAAATEEWTELLQAQSRLSHAANLIEVTRAAQDELADGDAAIAIRIAAVQHRLRQAASHDRALDEVVTLTEEAGIRIEEAARALRAYGDRFDLDPAELGRIEQRIGAILDVARKYRVRPEALAELAQTTSARLAALDERRDADGLARAEEDARRAYLAFADELSAKRRSAASDLGHRVTAMMQALAMAGGRFEVGLIPLAEPASYGLESIEFRVATHPKQPDAPLAQVASGGELSRLGLAIQVVLSDVAEVPTLVFDEVDAGIGGAVAATVGRLLQRLGHRRQVLCVTHLPQVAACAAGHYRVNKVGRKDDVATELTHLDAAGRVEEVARMLGGREITSKARAHARELLAQSHEP